MIRRALLLAVAGMLALPAAGSAAFTAMTWNVKGSPTSRGALQPPFDLDAVAAVIASESPDVVALQEVCGWQAQELATRLGLSAWHETAIAGFLDSRPGAAATGGVCDFGNALLSRAPLESRVRRELLGPAEGDTCRAIASASGPECRVAMLALANLRDAGPGMVRVGTLHVTPSNAQDRTLQLRRATADAERLEGVAILLGDFNAPPEDDRLSPLGALGFADAGGAELGTPCSMTPACSFTDPTPSFTSSGAGPPTLKPDYLFFRGWPGPVEARVLGGEAAGVNASDHFALVATFAADDPATPPVVTLTEPAFEGAATGARPRFAGEARPAGQPVTLDIVASDTVAGPPAMTLAADVAPDGTWAVEAPEDLLPGTYVARARQSAPGIEGWSSANRFVVEAPPPPPPPAVLPVPPAAAAAAAAEPLAAPTPPPLRLFAPVVRATVARQRIEAVLRRGLRIAVQSDGPARVFVRLRATRAGLALVRHLTGPVDLGEAQAAFAARGGRTVTVPVRARLRSALARLRRPVTVTVDVAAVPQGRLGPARTTRVRAVLSPAPR